MSIFILVYCAISVILIIFAEAKIQDGAFERSATFGERVILGVLWPIVLLKIVGGFLNGTVKITRDKK